MARDIDGVVKIKFANAGDVGLGGLDLNELWPVAYSTPGGPFPQRIQFNQLFRYLSALAVEINSKGPFLDWDGTAVTGPDYAVGAVVKGSDGNNYTCLIANGPATSIVDPVGDITGTWEDLSTILVKDLTPQLGGDLDTNGKYINKIKQLNSIENESKHLQTEDFFTDFVVTGLLPATSANLMSDISLGKAYVTGTRVVKGSATSNTYTASKDTYVDIDSTGAFTFSEVALGAGAPAIAADSIRLAKVVTDATAITSVSDLRTLAPSRNTDIIPAAGTVVQVVSKVITTQSSQTIAGLAVNDLIGSGTDFVLTITPKYDGSWFLIHHRWFGEAENNWYLARNITRDNVNVNGSGTTHYSALTVAAGAGNSTDDTGTPEIAQIETLDKGGSTKDTAITYRCVVSNGDNTNYTMWTNRCFQAPGVEAVQGTSEIIIMEIKQ